MSVAVLDLLSRSATPLTHEEAAIIAVALKESAEPYSLSSSHGLYQRLILTVTSASFPEVAVDFFSSCIALGSRGDSSKLLMDLLETGTPAIDKMVADCITAYPNGELPFKDPHVEALSLCVVLLSIVLPRGKFNTESVLQFAEGNQNVSIYLLGHAFAVVGGTRPGRKPLLQGDVKEQVVIELISAVRCFTSWKTFQAVSYERKVGKRSESLHVRQFSGQYRHYVSTVTLLLMKLPLFHDLSVDYELSCASQPGEHHGFVRETALLFENLITMTHLCTTQLRKSVVAAGVIDKIYVPFLESLRTHFHKTHLSIVYVIRVLATLAYNAKGVQATLGTRQKTFIRLMEEAHTDTSYYINFLFQSTRLVVNAKLADAVDCLVSSWNKLALPSKQKLFRIVVEESGQFSLLDTTSPTFSTFCSGIHMAYTPQDKKSDETCSVRTRRYRRRQQYRKLRKQQLTESQANSENISVSEEAPVKEESLVLEDIEFIEEEVEEIDIDLSEWRKGPPPLRIPLKYICSLTHRFIQSEAVVSPEGLVFDKVSISAYLQSNSRCPISGKPLKIEDLLVDDEINSELQLIRSDFLDI